MTEETVFPRCEVCGRRSHTQSQSVRHPEPRLLCWPCAKDEVAACEVMAEETEARGRSTEVAP